MTTADRPPTMTNRPTTLRTIVNPRRAACAVLMLASALMPATGCKTPLPPPVESEIATQLWWSPQRRWYAVVDPTRPEADVRQLGNRAVAAWTVPTVRGDEELLPLDDGRHVVAIRPTVAGPQEFGKPVVTFYEDGLILTEFKASDLVDDIAALKAVVPPAPPAAPETDPAAPAAPGTQAPAEPAPAPKPEPAKPVRFTWRAAGADTPDRSVVERGRALVFTTTQDRIVRFDTATGLATRGLVRKPDPRVEDSRKLLAAANPRPGEVLKTGVLPRALLTDLTGNLYVVDSAGGRIVRVLGDGTVLPVVEGLPGAIGAAAFAPDSAGKPGGGLVIALPGEGRIVRLLPDGRSLPIAETFAGKRLSAPTDLAFDPQGRLLFTDAGEAGATGAVYALGAGGRLVRLADKLDAPAGLVFSADGSELHVAERGRDRVLTFPVTRKPDLSIELGRPRIAAKLPAGTRPHGIARDVNGNLHVTGEGNGTLTVIAPTGEILATVDTGGNSSTAAVFGTGRTDATALFFVRSDRTGTAVWRADMGVVGQVRFHLPAEAVRPMGRVRLPDASPR